MNLQFSGLPAEGLRSPSQIARAISEDWCTREMFCPGFDADRLAKTASGSPACDFICGSCNERFELKSGKNPVAGRIPDSAYGAMVAAIRNDRTPTLLAMQYSPSLQVLNLLLIPRYFFTENVIEKRAPLSPNARRAGWVGCNIMLSRIPADGQIPVVINGVAADQAGIRERFAQAKALVQLSIPERGWTVDVLNGVRDLRRREFTLEEAYSLESHRALHLARVRVELLLNSGLPFRWLTVRVRLEVKLHVTEFAGPDKRNIPDSLDDPKVTLWHAPIVSHRALSRHLPRFSPASGPLRLPNRSISAIIDELLPQGM